MNIDELARGLASAFVIDHTSGVRSRIVRAGLAIVVVGVIAVVVGPLWLQIIAGVALVITFGIAGVGYVACTATISAVRRFAAPQDLARHRAAMAAAIDQADLPTGPISTARLAWRLRRGTSAELDRLRGVARELLVTLDDAGPAAES